VAAELIGHGVCPVCKSKGARVSLSKSGLAVLTCNACNAQLFTRSGRSDELVRAAIHTRAGEPAPAAAAPAPAAPAPAAPAPAAAQAPAPAPAAAKPRPAWGLGAWGR
jgi:pyruvate/2-oxoglutarate dehydrogenase complex dihydrolipoamide acyltransferase (E2) component